jgi:hypothetical protein
MRKMKVMKEKETWEGTITTEEVSERLENVLNDCSEGGGFFVVPEEICCPDKNVRN